MGPVNLPMNRNDDLSPLDELNQQLEPPSRSDRDSASRNRERDWEPEERPTSTSPGVYIRQGGARYANNLGNENSELDALMSLSRAIHRDDKQPFLFFMLGLLFGIVLTSLVFILFLNRPALPPIDEAATKLLNSSQQALTGNSFSGADQLDDSADDATPTQTEARSGREAAVRSPNEAGVSSSSNTNRTRNRRRRSSANSRGMRTYTVSSGDTLGGIAERFYGSSSPSLINKLQEANQLKNPNSLQLGQTLAIPPKEYE